MGSAAPTRDPERAAVLAELANLVFKVTAPPLLRVLIDGLADPKIDPADRAAARPILLRFLGQFLANLELKPDHPAAPFLENPND